MDISNTPMGLAIYGHLVRINLAAFGNHPSRRTTGYASISPQALNPKVLVKIIISLFFMIFMPKSNAQEMCFSCTGTKYLSGHQFSKEQTITDHAIGLCIEKSNMSITLDSEGSSHSKWRFVESIKDFGTVYYYWRKQYDNNFYGRLSEQVELSDVKFKYQYLAKDTAGLTAIAVNARCIPVTRINR